jgi:hypothetical protein
MKKRLCSLLLMCLFVPAFTQTIPPETWQEHWFEHNQLVERVFYDDDVAVYYDQDTPQSITWPHKYLGDVSRYIKKVYGPLSPENRIYVIIHTGKYSGGHPSYYYNASHDYRNVADNGPGSWTNPQYDVVTHEIGHIVESTPYGLKNSPAFNLWGDSKWCEIFNYDVYKGLGLTSEATRWHNNCLTQTHDKPVANSHWYRDWFYPLYTQYGGSAFLSRFFQLLGDFWDGGSLNWGQYVHFTSGAAGKDLRDEFKRAFGESTWTSTMEAQFIQAQADFPFSYNATAVKSGAASGAFMNITQIHATPNPFKTSTTINFTTSTCGATAVSVYTVTGALLTTLYHGETKPGMHTVQWNGADDSGKLTPAGVYFCRLQHNGSMQTSRITLVQ